MVTHRSLLSILIILLLLPLQSPAAELRWEREKTITTNTHIGRDDRLIIPAGSRIRISGGDLEISGTLEATSATFLLQGGGMILQQGKAVIRDCRFEGGKTALLVRGGDVQIEGSTFAGGEVGVEIRQQARTLVKNSTFTGQRKVGLFVKDESTPLIVGNRFEGGKKFALYLHRSTPEATRDNLFIANDTAIMASGNGTTPLISANRFEKNAIALFADRSATPRVEGNRFTGNETALKAHRRSDPEVTGNLFAENRVGITLSFSSYPLISGNDFEGNATALYLEYQSAVWEEQRGEETRGDEIARMSAFGQKQKHTPAAEAKPLRSRVDARNNWWGESGTRELATPQGSTNPTFIDDGRDRPRFIDNGGEFPLDQVDFAPWATTPNLTKETDK